MCLVILVIGCVFWCSRFLVIFICYDSRYFIGGWLMVWVKWLKNVECESVIVLVSCDMV